MNVHVDFDLFFFLLFIIQPSEYQLSSTSWYFSVYNYMLLVIADSFVLADVIIFICFVPLRETPILLDRQITYLSLFLNSIKVLFYTFLID